VKPSIDGVVDGMIEVLDELREEIKALNQELERMRSGDAALHKVAAEILHEIRGRLCDLRKEQPGTTSSALIGPDGTKLRATGMPNVLSHRGTPLIMPLGQWRAEIFAMARAEFRRDFANHRAEFDREIGKFAA
jgi:hypothetical protein